VAGAQRRRCSLWWGGREQPQKDLQFCTKPVPNLISVYSLTHQLHPSTTQPPNHPHIVLCARLWCSSIYPCANRGDRARGNDSVLGRCGGSIYVRFCALGKLLFWGPTPNPRELHPGTVNNLPSSHRLLNVWLWFCCGGYLCKQAQ
jgi:hypothetical protein